jgi:CubicO group peptidase (beta-lactamase class C family)
MRVATAYFALAILMLAAGSARADAVPCNQAAAIAATVDPIIEAELATTGAPGAAFVFVRGGRIVYARGYGVSDLATGDRADPARTIWPIASITKTVTALAVLQLVDQGRVRLDEDINHYLRRLQVPAQGYRPLTLRHLLSHTGGLDELPGRQFDGAGRRDMAEFIRSRIVRYRAPGRLTAYSTYGIMLAAIVLEDVTGESYADYVRDHILGPAGMASARIMAVRGDDRGVAAPYRLVDGRAEALPFEYYVSTPASSMVATAEDMGRLLLIHLAAGRGGAHRLLSPRLMRAMHSQQATVHPALPGWSLGMQMDRANGRTIVEHGGDIGGFAALFVLLPEENAGFFIVSHGEGSDLRFRVRQALIDRLFPARRRTRVPAPRAANAAALREYAGRYISSLSCHSCAGADDDAFTVEARPDGTLALWGQIWIPLRRDLFIRADGQRLLGFARDAQGRPATVSAGSWRVADRVPDRPAAR